jgi:hypothetical protein
MIGKWWRRVEYRVVNDPGFRVFFIYAFGCSLAAVAVAVIFLIGHLSLTP